MGWRRKQVVGAPDSPKKGRKKKQGTNEAKAQQSAQDSAEPCSVDDDDSPDRQNGPPGAFFGCYLLSSINPKRKGATYIGFTVNPARRLRQHNGELTAGAWKTKKMRPVEMVLVVYGFPSMVHALQFEWAWQHPTVSLAVKEAAASIKNRGGVKGKVALLYAMLSLPKWRKLPLVVQFVSSRHLVHKLGLPPLPDHMDCVLGPLSSLRIKVDDTAQDPPILDPPDHSSASGPPEEAPEEGGSTESQDVAPNLINPDHDSTPPPPPSLPASGNDQSRSPQRSNSGWADPLSDWDWLDQEEPNLCNESSTDDRGEMNQVDAFSTWQRLKAPKWIPKGSPKKGSKEGAGVPQDRGLCESLERDGSVWERRGNQGDKCVGHERIERSATELGSEGAVRSDRPQAKGAVLVEREVPGEARDCRESALTERQCLAPPCSVSFLGEFGAEKDRERETVDLVGSEDEGSSGYQERGSKRTNPQTRCQGDDVQDHPNGDNVPSLLGVELVVLEDSPPLQKSNETRKLRKCDKAPARTRVDSHSTLSLVGNGQSIHRTTTEGKGAGRSQNHTIVIDLDP